MDIESIKQLLTENMPSQEEYILSPTLEQKTIILEVKSIEDGLKKASDLFDLSPEEIKAFPIDGSETPDGKIRIEYKQKMIAGNSNIVISDDKLTATIPKLYPRLPLGTEISPEYIYDAIKELGVTTGVNNARIQKAVSKAVTDKKILMDVVIAEGTPTSGDKKAELIEGMFKDISDIDNLSNHETTLSNIFKVENYEDIEDAAFPAVFVKKNEVIATTSFPKEGKPGLDVFGEIVESGKENNLFKTGNNIKFTIDEQQIIYTALLSGYLDYDNGTLNIKSPIWISQDKLSGVFIRLPLMNTSEVVFTHEVIQGIVEEAQITKGVIPGYEEEVIAMFTGDSENKSVQVAIGHEGENGQDAYVEMFFSKDQTEGKVLERGTIDYTNTDRRDYVKPNQLLAVKFLQSVGNEGYTILGEIIPATEGNDVIFTAYNNVRSVPSEGKITFFATQEGIVDIVGDQGISVNKLLEIPGDVDNKTGNIASDGNVHIKGTVQAGFNVIAEGNISVDGSLSQKVNIEAAGNVVVKEGIVGRRDILIKSKGTVSAKFVQGAIIETDGDVIVRESIINSDVFAAGNVYTPSKTDYNYGKGSIIESSVNAMCSIYANIAGSDISKSTKLAAGNDYNYESKMKELQKAHTYCETEITKITRTLRVGINDMDKIKNLLKKLPPQKQKPFLIALKKLMSVNNLRAQVNDTIGILQEGVLALADKGEVIVKRDVYPGVLIQVGDTRLKTQKLEKNILAKLNIDKNKLLISNPEEENPKTD